MKCVTRRTTTPLLLLPELVTVYVDNMRAPYGRLIMCHMLADTDDELHAMAATIGVNRRWWQSPEKTSGSHYDIALSKRALAVAAGAVEITLRQAGAMNYRRKKTGSLGDPSDAVDWMRADRGLGPEPPDTLETIATADG